MHQTVTDSGSRDAFRSTFLLPLFGSSRLKSSVSRRWLSTQGRAPRRELGLGREVDLVPGQGQVGGHLEVGVLHVEKIERILTAG